ncbi:MAG TPA: hypothetical protein VNM69_01910 [Bacillus sp. (in: firmicutes)]|nr:hypothetical protein [Bacillus sp. (in: firmicutes)]
MDFISKFIEEEFEERWRMKYKKRTLQRTSYGIFANWRTDRFCFLSEVDSQGRVYRRRGCRSD